MHMRDQRKTRDKFTYKLHYQTRAAQHRDNIGHNCKTYTVYTSSEDLRQNGMEIKEKLSQTPTQNDDNEINSLGVQVRVGQRRTLTHQMSIYCRCQTLLERNSPTLREWEWKSQLEPLQNRTAFQYISILFCNTKPEYDNDKQRYKKIRTGDR